MMPLIVSGLSLIGFTLFLLVFFKANAGILFLSACAGVILLQSLDPVVISAAGAVLPSEGEAYVKLLVVLLSMLFAAMMFRHSVKPSQLAIHGLLAVVTGLLLWLLLPSTTGLSWLRSAVREDIWQTLKSYETLVVSLGFCLSLVVVLLSKGSHGHAKQGKH